MADLTTTRSAQRPGLAHRVRREVVMVHEALELLRCEAVQILLVGHRTEGRDRERLGLAAGEKARSMRATKHTDLDGDWVHVLQAAAVDADALLDAALAHTLLNRLIQEMP